MALTGLGGITGQVVEQMCVEFEREMASMWKDVLMYRDELDRVAQLLGVQLEREKKLHGLLQQPDPISYPGLIASLPDRPVAGAFCFVVCPSTETRAVML